MSIGTVPLAAMAAEAAGWAGSQRVSRPVVATVNRALPMAVARAITARLMASRSAGGMMLGVCHSHSRYPATDTELPPGSVLALYTDGLIELPGQDISTGMSRLARTLAASPAQSLDQLCDSVLTGPGPYARDDTALLLARTTGTAR